MKSNFVEFHQDSESIFINKNLIIAFYTNDYHLGKDYITNTVIECGNNCTYEVDENINDVIKCLE